MTHQINDDAQLVREIAQLPDAPAPLHTVDITRAVRDGRSRIRRRRVAAAAAVSGLVAAATALAVLAGGLTGTSSAPKVEPAHRPAGASFTMMRGFGWLPPYFEQVSWGWHQGQGLMPSGSWATGFAPNTQELRGATVSVDPRPGLDLGQNHYSDTTVNGRPAYWLASPQPLYGWWGVMLWWQLADGRWMYMTGSNLPGADLKKNMLHIAAAYDTRAESIRLPFFLSDTGPGFGVNSLQMHSMDGGATWSLQAEFRRGAYSGEMVVGTERLIDTFVAARHNDCRTQAGVKVCTYMGFLRYGTTPNADDAAWIQQFLHLKHITLLGNDQRQWTSDVLR